MNYVFLQGSYTSQRRLAATLSTSLPTPRDREMHSIRRRTLVTALFVFFVLLGLRQSLIAQRPTTTVPEVGVRDRAPQFSALTNATVVTEPGEVLENATLLIERGRIVDVLVAGEDVPPSARVLDMSGKTIYPALIDAFSEIEVTETAAANAHWNPKARPERTRRRFGLPKQTKTKSIGKQDSRCG